MDIAVIVGSLRRDSFNAKLARAIAKLAPADFTFKHSQIGDLPLYNQDDDANQAPQVKRLKGEIAAAQGLLFVTPEYNRSVPGVLKNAIDHASRPYGQSAFAGKPAGVIGVSVGAIGTAARAAASSQHPRLSRRPDAWPARGVYPGQRGPVRVRRQHWRCKPAVPARLDGPVCRLGEEAHGLSRALGRLP